MLTDQETAILNEAIAVERYVDKRGRKWERIENPTGFYRWTTMDFGTSNWNISEPYWIKEIFQRDQRN